VAIRDEITTILRAELGEGYETTSYPALVTAYLRRELLPKLQAIRRRAINRTVLETARTRAEDALRNEADVVKQLEAASDAKAETDMGGL